jgi:hypothetical protein
MNNGITITEAKREGTLPAVARSAKPPEGPGRDVNKSLMRKRSGHDVPSPTGISAGNIFFGAEDGGHRPPLQGEEITAARQHRPTIEEEVRELLAEFRARLEEVALLAVSPYRDRKGAAAYLGGCSAAHISDLAASGDLPVDAYDGVRPLWKVETLERYLERNTKAGKGKHRTSNIERPMATEGEVLTAENA